MEGKWDFTLSDGSALRVLAGTGHWSQVINTHGEVVRSVYVFEADRTYPGGETKATFILRNELRRLRRAAASTAAQPVAS